MVKQAMATMPIEASPRIHNIYTEESILPSYTPVEGRIVKL